MNIRQRKMIGGLGLAVFSIIYYLFVISVAVVRLPSLATPWHLLFYFLAVVIWFIPSAALVRWTSKGG